MQDRVGKALDLSLIDMTIGTQDAVILSIALTEALHLAGTQVPGIEGLANHAAMLTIHLKALVPVHAYRHREIEMPNAAIGELGVDKPAVGTELFDEPGLNADDVATQKASGIDEVAGVAQ